MVINSSGMLLRAFLCIGLLGTSAFAEWQRHIHSFSAGIDRDSPPAHPLAYFRVDPCLRPDSDPLPRAFQCNGPHTAAQLEYLSKTYTKVRQVGKIGAFTIYDLEYFKDGQEYLKGEPDTRSILVEVSPDQLHEIHVQPNAVFGKLFPSEILQLGQERILKTQWDDGGTYHSVIEQYFLISANGDELLDLKPINEAASGVLPKGIAVFPWSAKFVSGSSTWQSATSILYPNTSRPYGQPDQGVVTVTFRIVDGRIVVTAAKYQANAKQ